MVIRRQCSSVNDEKVACKIYEKQTKKYNNLKNDKTSIIKIGKTAIIDKKVLNQVEKATKQLNGKYHNFNVCILILIGIVLILVSFAMLLFFADDLSFVRFERVELTNFDYETNNVDVDIYFSSGILNNDRVYCLLSDEEVTDFDEEFLVEAVDNKCTINKVFDNYYIYLLKDDDIVFISTIDNITNEILKFDASEEIIYLAKGASRSLDYDLIKSGNEDVNISSLDPSIATVSSGVVIGISNGETEIVLSIYDEMISISVVVSDLIVEMPKEYNYKKAFLPCNRYSDEENKLLDDILEARVKEAGYLSRAGVVAAARFLTLEFPYRLNYFLENGRMKVFTDARTVDGEGRYYHKGLYLSDSKFSSIESSSFGPSIWGCPLYEASFDRTYINGLDCSGFVAWALLNGGFDVGDIGSAGFVYDQHIPDLSQLGQKTSITRSLLESGLVKAGDLISFPGHQAIIVGITEDNIYVAEELNYNVGLNVLTFNYNNISSYFTDITLMDSYYNNDGAYTNVWY